MARKKKQDGIEPNIEVGGIAIAPRSVEELTIVIDAPMGICREGYASGHVEVGSLLPKQAAALKRIRCSLSDQAARALRRDAMHPDGRVVDSNADAIRWILDQCAEQFQATTGIDILKGQKF